jgi:hypothetical protein
MPATFEAYHNLLIRVCGTGFRKEGEDVDPLKVWNKFYQAVLQAAEGKMTREEVRESVREFDRHNDAQNIIEHEIERLAEEKETHK